MRISFGELEVKFQMLILQWCNDCQNEAGDKPFSKHKTKKGSFPGNHFFFYLNQFSNLKCRSYLNEKIPRENSILNVKKTLVVTPMWHVSSTWKKYWR